MPTLARIQADNRRFRARVTAAVELALTKYPPETVCVLVWNKYGVCADVTPRGTIALGGLDRIFAEVTIPTEGDPGDALDLLPDDNTEHRQQQSALFDDTECLPLFSGTAPRGQVRPFVETDAPPAQLPLL